MASNRGSGRKFAESDFVREFDPFATTPLIDPRPRPPNGTVRDSSRDLAAGAEVYEYGDTIPAELIPYLDP